MERASFSRLSHITSSTVFSNTKSSAIVRPPTAHVGSEPSAVSITYLLVQMHFMAGSKSVEPDIKYATISEWDSWKQKRIEDNLLRLTREETAQNSYMHNLCIALLVGGYHKSFEEIFELAESRRKARLKGGVDSVLWKKPLLSDEYGKLNVLRRYLTKAELASRRGKWETAYKANHALAIHFYGIEDFWLSNYFLKKALMTSFKIRIDGRRSEAEALYYMGLAAEREGDIASATRYMEDCYQLSLGRSWTNDVNETLEVASLNLLSKLFSTLGMQCENPESALPLFKRAFELAKEGESPYEIARASLRLGWCYHQLKDNKMAMEYLSECFKTAQNSSDVTLKGDSFLAIALSHYEQGNLERCISILQQGVATFDNTEERKEISKTTSCLGTIHNYTGEYGKAADAMTKAYDQTEWLGRDEETLVQVGITKGNRMLSSYMKNIETPPIVMTTRFMLWKDVRESTFDDPIPEEPQNYAEVGKFLWDKIRRQANSDLSFFKVAPSKKRHHKMRHSSTLH